MSHTTFYDHLGFSVFYQRTDYRIDDLLWGVLFGMLWARGWFPRRALAVLGWAGVAILGVVLVVATPLSRWVYLWGMPVMAIAAAAVILTCVEVDWPIRRLLEARWLCAVGVLSYGIYVWHLLGVRDRGPGRRPLARRSAGGRCRRTGGRLALGSWFLIEKPCLRLKDRLRRRHAAAAEPPWRP